MSAPVWLALPPEVHSALLSSGPGPGPLLESASAWSALSTEYASAATELDGLLGAVQAGAWQGPSAQRYAVAHGPYLTWLSQSAANAGTAAGMHQTAAAAYSSALATMPTLAEIAANHATQATLVATNFFGINTIPIALNEADYVRMWIQAAETMTVYQAVAGSALAAVPAATPAPPILAPAAEAQATQQPAAASSSWQDQLATLLSYYTQGFAQPLGELLYPDGWPFPAVPFASGVASSLMQAFPGLSPALASALGWTVFHTLVIVISPQFLVTVIPAVTATTGAAGLAGLAGIPGNAPVPAEVASAPAGVAPAGAPAPAGAAAPIVADPCICADMPAGSTPGMPNAGAVNPAPPGAAPASGGPGVGFGPTSCLYLVSGASSSAKQATGSRRSRSSEEEAAQSQAAPAEAAAQRQAHKHRRRQRAKQRGYGNEFMDMNIEISPDWGRPATADSPLASTQGVGVLGFTGTAAATKTEAAGLTALADDRFGGGPHAPMLPSSWNESADSQN